jgi:hypothetical protein
VKAARKRRAQVWHPAGYDITDIRAVQATAAGTATPEQQKRALDWIVVKAAATYDNGFVAEDAHGRIAAFVDGRQSVGQQIVKLMKLKPEIFEGERG